LDTGPFRLMRLFKREVGLTMHQFVIKKRIEYVKDQLANSKLSLVQIAYDAGFSSQSHMNACYVKEMGISPGRHRQILKS
ncbi:MAG: AraC family transcriptional regulator, partial [Pseudomonadota bacterium]